MRIIYRIINKDNDEDDCLYELTTTTDDPVYLWQYLSRVKLGDDVKDYPILYLGMERNFDDFDASKNEIAGQLRFEPEDLGGENAN